MAQSIVFIDTGITDYQSLLAGIPGTDNEIVLIDSSKDGIAQMLDALAGRSGIDAIHIIGHGSAGALILGTTTINSDTMSLYQAQLSELGSHLTASGDLLLYGCNVAQGVDGQAFIEQLAQITRADVAASTDLTGSAVLGGDWVLEAQTGNIATQTLAVIDYQASLAVTDVYVQLSTGLPIHFGETSPGTWLMNTNTTAGSNTVTVNVTGLAADEQWSLYVDVSTSEVNGSTGNARTDTYNTTPVTGLDNFPANTGNSTFTADGTNTSFKVVITKKAGPPPPPPPPENTAPTASNGTLTVSEGQTNSINLATLANDAETASDSLTYSGTGVSGTNMSYTAGTAASLKGTQSVGNQSYTVTDPGGLSASASVGINVIYADDPTSWNSGPTNQVWATPGTNSYQLSGAYDPDDNVYYSIISGAPSWMHISNGQIYGNVAPEYAGQTYNLTVRASGSTVVDKTFTITTGTAAQLNDIPTTTGGTQTVAEDAMLTFAAGNFNFADLDNSVGGSAASGAVLTSIRIDNLPTNGTLKLSGTDVTAMQVILRADLDSGNLTFTPTANYNGSDNFTYSVNDGVSYSAAPATMSLTATSINDAPVLSGMGVDMAGITEDATNDAGQTVASILATVNDVDTTIGSAVHGATNGLLQGIAIHSATITGPSADGTWQYKVGAGSWTVFGAVSDTSALLLKSDDMVRFVPDAKNGQTASFDYYAWDQATGSAGSKVNVTIRDGSTAFSLNGDTASITITHINDAPLLDLDANNSSTAAGNDFITTFRPRGAEVAVVDSDITITDVDKLHLTDVTQRDTITKAVVEITAGALDNSFGPVQESLTAQTGVGGTIISTYTGTLGDLIITGNGSARVEISGVGTWADYQNALKTFYYYNSNPNAFAGNRTVTISVTDGAVTVGGGASDQLTTTSSTTVLVPWTPVVDMDGNRTADWHDRNFNATYTEDAPAIAVARADASITAQGGLIRSITATLTNPVDGTDEALSISAALITTLTGKGITTTYSNNNHTVIFTAGGAGADATNFQIALRGVKYLNSSQDPTTDNRIVTVSTLGVDNNTGVSADTVITIVAVNDAPIIAAIATTNLNEQTTSALLSSPITATFGDVDFTQTGHSAVITGVAASGVTAGLALGEAELNALVSIGTVTKAFGAVTGSIPMTFNAASTTFDYLALGEVITLTYTLEVNDHAGATHSKTFVVQIAGTNDAPVIAAITQADLTEKTGTALLTTSIAVTFSDADLTDIGHVATITGVVTSDVNTGLALDAAALKALITVGAVTKATGTTDGTLGLDFSAASTAFDYLAAGEKLTLTYTLTVNDGDTGITTKDFVVTVTGTNDAPVIAAITQADLTEQTGAAALTTHIGVTFSDVDLGDIGHTASVTGVVTSDVTTGLALDTTALKNLITVGAVTKTAGSSAGTLTLDFSAASTVFDYLAAGEKLTLTYTLTVNDGDTGVTTKDFVVTVTGTNDAPVIAATTQADLTEKTDTALLTTSIAVTFSDADLT
ncbi:MAG: DUF4347 domain-containing protein, partial [Desulfuromonadaceae bacterium]